MKLTVSLVRCLGLLVLAACLPPGLAAAQHTVEEGDTLTALSRKYGVSVAEIRAANGLQDDHIVQGKALKIPKPVGKTQTTDSSTGPIQVRRAQPVDPRQMPVDRPDIAKPAKVGGTSGASRAASGSYTVQSGDNLSKLAARYGTSIAALRAANGLDGETITIGQALVIPEKGKAPKATPVVTEKPAEPKKSEPPAVATAKTTPPPVPKKPKEVSAGTEHFVLEGDRLAVLAKRYGVSVESIRAANSLDGDFIRVGQMLVIPNKGAPTPKPPAETAVTAATPPKSALDKLAQATPGAGAPAKPEAPVWERPEHYLDLVDLGAPAGSPKVKGQEAAPQPTASATAPPAEPEPAAKPVVARDSHVVEEGDSLWKIARQHKVSIDQLRTANGLKDDSLQIGQKLVVP